MALAVPAHAAKSDYELLVQRNLELREKISVLEEKYTALENERNALIGHVRNLQQEKEGLLTARKDVKADKRYRDLEAAFNEVSKKIGTAMEERDRLARELAQAQKTQEDNQAAVRRLEADQQRSQTGDRSKLVSEKQALEQQLKAAEEKVGTKEKEWAVARSSYEADKAALKSDLEKIDKENRSASTRIRSLEQENKDLAQRYEQVDRELKSVRGDFGVKEDALKAMEERIAASEKAWAAERTSYEKREAELKISEEKNAGVRKERAIELAFYKAREMDLAQKHKTLLSEYDQIKADVQRLTKVNAALKDTEQKWQQAQKDLNAARADSRDLETRNKKLENKLTKLNIFKTRVKKTEEDLKALQMLQKEHEAMIRRLTLEKTALEARLARIEAPAGVDAARDARRKGTLSPANKQKLDMHFNLAVAYDKTKMYKAEEREYMECLGIDPKDANVHYNLGILYDDKLNDNAQAIKHYRRYLEVCTTCEDAEDVKEWIMHAEQQQRL